MSFYFAPREAKTTLKCPQCESNLDIRRSCHEAYMYCPSCRKIFELSLFVDKMDKAMEEFLENLYADRI